MYHIRPPVVAFAHYPQKTTVAPTNTDPSGFPPPSRVWQNSHIVELAEAADTVHRVTGIFENPRYFVPNPHLCDAINEHIVQSEIEGGVHLRDVVPGTVLEVLTQNRSYTIEYQGSGQALISGHPVFCPQPVLVNIHGSTWGGSMLKERYIGRGMCLEFAPPTNPAITTSVIVEVRETLKAA